MMATYSGFIAGGIIAALIFNGIYWAFDEYLRNGWRKPTQWYDRNNGVF